MLRVVGGDVCERPSARNRRRSLESRGEDVLLRCKGFRPSACREDVNFEKAGGAALFMQIAPNECLATLGIEMKRQLTCCESVNSCSLTLSPVWSHIEDRNETTLSDCTIHILPQRGSNTRHGAASWLQIASVDCLFDAASRAAPSSKEFSLLSLVCLHCLRALP